MSAGRWRDTSFGRLATIWGPALVVMVAIFWTSSVEHVSRMPGDLSDKVVHFSAFGLLGACMFRGVAGAAFANVTGARALRAWLLTAAYGATDEWHQAFVPGRTMALDDWMADAAGAATAVGLLLLVRWRVVPNRTV